MVQTKPIPFTSSANTSILPIVTSQRDRFRQRNAELEEVGIILADRSSLLMFTPHVGTPQTIPNNL